MCAHCGDEDNDKESYSSEDTESYRIPVPLILQDMLCTLAKRVLDELDKQGSLVDMFANWDADQITEYEQTVEYAFKSMGAPMVDEDHVVNDAIQDDTQ